MKKILSIIYIFIFCSVQVIAKETSDVTQKEKLSELTNKMLGEWKYEGRTIKVSYCDVSGICMTMNNSKYRCGGKVIHPLKEKYLWFRKYPSISLMANYLTLKLSGKNIRNYAYAVKREEKGFSFKTEICHPISGVFFKTLFSYNVKDDTLKMRGTNLIGAKFYGILGR